MNHYTSKRNISRSMISKIHRYLEYAHQEEISGYKRGSNLISLLSESLKAEINIESYLNLFKKVKHLSKNISEDTLKKFCLKMKEENYGPNDIIHLVIFFKFLYKSE